MFMKGGGGPPLFDVVEGVPKSPFSKTGMTFSPQAPATCQCSSKHWHIAPMSSVLTAAPFYIERDWGLAMLSSLSGIPQLVQWGMKVLNRGSESPNYSNLSNTAWNTEVLLTELSHFS